MTPEQKKLYDSIVHGLRMAGWTKLEAETEALDRVLAPPQPNPIKQEKTDD